MIFLRKGTSIIFVLVFAVIIIYYGCKSGMDIPVKVFEKFPLTYQLKGKVIDPCFPVFRGFLDIHDSLLIMFIFSPDGKDMPLHIYNKNNFTLVASAGARGRGPGETVNPGDFTVDRATGDIWLVDYGQNAMLRYTVRDIINGITTYCANVPIPSQYIFHPSVHDGGFYYTEHTNPVRLLSFFDFSGNSIDSLAIPDKEDLHNLATVSEDNLPMNYDMLSFFFTFRPDMERLAITYRYSDVITITDIKGNIINKVVGPDKIVSEIFNPEERIRTYQYGVKADDNFIYAYYRNTPLVHSRRLPGIPDGIIHIFDWEGNPVCRLETDDRIMSFAIDHENSRLITFEPVEARFVYYDLPESVSIPTRQGIPGFK